MANSALDSIIGVYGPIVLNVTANGSGAQNGTGVVAVSSVYTNPE